MTDTALTSRRWMLDPAAAALLLGVSVVGFWPTFGDGSYLVAAIAAVLLGLGIAAVCAWRRWGILITAGLTIAVYLVLGGPLALPHTTIIGVVPTLDTLQQLVVGAVTSWKRLLTTIAPVAASDGHLLVPFLLLLVASALTGSLALRLRHAGWALIPAGGALMLVIALGTPTPAAPVAQGIAFAIVAAAWLSLRQMWAPQTAAVSVGQADPARQAQLRWRRAGAGAVVVALAAGTGIATSTFAAPAQPRHVFRDTIVPPFDIHDYPSPLQAFRKYVRDDLENTLFTVRGLPEDARVRLAAMDTFTGQVYNVSDDGIGASGAFTPLRGNMSADAEGSPATVQVEIGTYQDVWIPGAGRITDLAFHGGERAEQLRRSTYYNESSSTAISTLPLIEGDEYTFDTILPDEVEDEQLADAEFASVTMPKQTDVPEDLANLAAETTEDAESPIEKVRMLELFLAEGGFFSHGLEGEVISRAGHTAERIATLIGGDQMIGDDEQYAVAMALLAREIDIPARVVLGFYPDEDADRDESFAVTGDDVHAWVEVAFDGFGWVPFDPTPPEDKVPNDQNTKPRADPKPQVLQPPPPPQEPVDLPPVLPDDREAEDDRLDIVGILFTVLAIGGISLGILALLASPFIVIGAWKAAKRRSRRSAERPWDRISGGWDELTDRAVDYGVRFAPGGTRIEEAGQVSEALAVPTVAVLAQRADAGVFGPSEPSEDEVRAFWDEVDEIVGGIGAQAGFWKRMKARLNLRSLLGGSGLARGFQNLRSAAAGRRGAGPGTIESSSTPPAESENS